MADHSILNRVLREPFLYLYLAAAIFPFLFWAALAKLSRNRPDILPHVYPLLKVLIWVAYASMVGFGLYSVFDIWSPRRAYRVFVVLMVLSQGFNFVYHWVRRRVDPASYKKFEGWWPSPKGSADTFQ